MRGFVVLQHDFMTGETMQYMRDSQPSWQIIGCRMGAAEPRRPRREELLVLPWDVRVYWTSGLMSLKGELFRMGDYGAELQESLAQAIAFRLCKVKPFGYTLSNGRSYVAGRVGHYSLFFGSTHMGLVGMFQNLVTLEKWMPGCRTCRDYVVLLQRRARKATRARKALPFAMALHGRLGEGSNVGGLGEDIVQKICEML